MIVLIVVGVVVGAALILSLIEYRHEINQDLRNIDKFEHDLHIRHLARNNGKRP